MDAFGNGIDGSHSVLAGPSRTSPTMTTKGNRLHSHDDSDEEKGANKKAKTRSCDDCRRRKVKCVMLTEDLCESCRVNGRPCTFLHEGKKREKPVTKKDAEVLQAKIRNLEKLLDEVLPGVDLSQLPRTLDQARTIVKANRREVGPSPLSDQQAYGTLLEEEDAEDGVHEDPELSIQPGRFVGPHSALSVTGGSLAKKDSLGGPRDPVTQLDDDQSRSLVERLLEREHLRKRRMDTSFPPPDLAASLIDLYFRRVHRWDPIIHKPTFIQLYSTDAATTDASFRALCYAIFATASRFSNDPRVLSDGQYGQVTKQGAGAIYGAASYLCASAPSVPWNLFDLQYAAVMSRFLTASSSPTTVWQMTGCWIRTAQDVGSHREKTPQWTRSIMHDQLRKRAFWFLIKADRQASLALGRNANIRESQIDLDPPLFITDDALSELDERFAGRDATSTRAHWAELKPPLDRPLLVAEERWHEIKNVVPAMVEKRYNSDWGAFASSTAPAKKFRDQIEQQIYSLLEPVRELLRYPPPDNADLEHFVACVRSSADLYFARCLLYRSNLASEEAISMCVESAMGTIAIFEECRVRGVLEDGCFLAPQYLIMAVMMLLFAHKRFLTERRPLADAILMVVKRGISLLSCLSRTTYLADKVQATISRIITEVELKISAYDEGRDDNILSACRRQPPLKKQQTRTISQLLMEAKTAASSSAASTDTARTVASSSRDSDSLASSPGHTKEPSRESSVHSAPSSLASASEQPAPGTVDPFALFGQQLSPLPVPSSGQAPAAAPGVEISDPGASSFDFATAAADSSAFWELFGFDQIGTFGAGLDGNRSGQSINPFA